MDQYLYILIRISLLKYESCIFCVSVWLNERQRHMVLFTNVTYTEARVTQWIQHLPSYEDIMSYYAMTYFCGLISTDTGPYRDLI